MDIFNLLHIDADAIKDFPLLAGRVADHQTERVINRNTLKLQRIEEKILVSGNINTSPQSIEEVIQKVIRASRKKDGEQGDWTFHELRIVSYYLMKLRAKTEYYQFALRLLDTHWKNPYFNGLVFYLINSWHTIGPRFREMTCLLLVKHLKKYKDSNRRYLLYKNHANFFEPTGPLRMAALVKQKGMSILDAPKILGFKMTGIEASYYSDVIINFFMNHEFDDFDIMDKVFEKHNLDRTRKLVLAHLVDRESQRKDGVKRTKLCHYINRTMGDITLASTWAPFLGATTEEAEYLKHAMRTANNWYTQQFIESFFEICVQDPARKRFWLQYVNEIDEIKIVGSQAVKSLLRTNDKIAGLFMKHFIETVSYTTQTAALIMFIKNKVIVEFSDKGALYVYDCFHPLARKIKRKSHEINSISDLKIPSMNKLIDNDNYYNNYYGEGKLVHIGYWQDRLKGWLEEMVISKTPLLLDHEDIFHATSFEDEDSEITSTIPDFYEDSEPQPEDNGETETMSDFSDNEQSSTVNESESDDYETATFVIDTRTKILTRRETEPDKPKTQESSGFLNRLKKRFRTYRSDNNTKSSNSGGSDTKQITQSELYNYNYNDKVSYQNEVNELISSKQLAKHLKVIASDDGYYLYDSYTTHYALLLRMSVQKDNYDSIWLKKTHKRGWMEIIHHKIDDNITIGFLNIPNSNGNFWFKSEWQTPYLKCINFN